jgi:hypothetical protein
MLETRNPQGSATFILFYGGYTPLCSALLMKWMDGLDTYIYIWMVEEMLNQSDQVE